MNPQTLAALHAACFSATRAWSAAEFTDLLEHDGTFAVGNADSFALIRTVLDEAEVLTIATHPGKRRHGLARRTLADGEAQAQAQGATSVFLEVAEDNAPAITLYASSGYVQVGRRPGYYMPKDRPAVAALVMRKALVAS